MVIWRGSGVLVLVLAVVGLLVSQGLAWALLGDPLPSSYIPARDMIGIWLGAGFLFVTNLALERSNKPRTVIDKETGKELVLKEKHDFFFIPMKYWPYLLLLLGVIAYFKK